MQGLMTITKKWTNINDLVYLDVNGNALTATVAAGDTVKLHGVVADLTNTILLQQGVLPVEDNKLGAITIAGDVIIGVTEDIFLKTEKEDKAIVVEIVKGA